MDFPGREASRDHRTAEGAQAARRGVPQARGRGEGAGRRRRWHRGRGQACAEAPRAASRNGKGTGRRGRPKGSGQRAQQALELVRSKPGITIPEMAEAMGIQQNYLYRVVPDLAKQGLVSKSGKGWHVRDVHIVSTPGPRGRRFPGGMRRTNCRPGRGCRRRYRPSASGAAQRGHRAAARPLRQARHHAPARPAAVRDPVRPRGREGRPHRAARRPAPRRGRAAARADRRPALRDPARRGAAPRAAQAAAARLPRRPHAGAHRADGGADGARARRLAARRGRSSCTSACRR